MDHQLTSPVTQVPVKRVRAHRGELAGFHRSGTGGQRRTQWRQRAGPDLLEVSTTPGCRGHSPITNPARQNWASRPRIFGRRIPVGRGMEPLSRPHVRISRAVI